MIEDLSNKNYLRIWKGKINHRIKNIFVKNYLIGFYLLLM